MPDDALTDPSAQELAVLVRQIRNRVRSRYPTTAPSESVQIPLADLMPILHARDAAEGKVAAIGTVNPRPPGPLNAAIQLVKRLLARALDWHVREQVEFNRAVLTAFDAILEALNQINRTFLRVGGLLDELRQELQRRSDLLQAEAAELKDIRAHWSAWRAEWERKLADHEIHFLRTLAELQGAFQNRVTLAEANFRDLVRNQHSDFVTELERSATEIQRRLWADLEQVRLDFERLIHSELRLLRQRAAAISPSATPTQFSPTPSPPLDWLKFAERFRGSEDYVKAQQRFYLPFFTNCRAVADLGCGRGEFLELLGEAGIPARGVDLSQEAVALCRAKGLTAEAADLFLWLEAQPDASLDGLFCAQVLEHLPPERLPDLFRSAARVLRRDGRLVVETPNPECLAIFATHYYLDPTHRHPIPPALLVFYFEEHGFGAIEVHRRSPAWEAIPALLALPEEFRHAFFGGLDYAVIGRKLT